MEEVREYGGGEEKVGMCILALRAGCVNLQCMHILYV